MSAEDSYKLKGIPELAESSRGMWFGSFNVSNLAFLFTPDELKSGRIPAINGMQKLYFCRYQESYGQYGELDGDFWSFSSTSGYAFCVFSSIAHIRSDVDKMMYCARSSQGDHAYIKTFLLADCWHYIHSFLLTFGDSMSVTQVKKRACTKVSTYDLTQKKLRLETALEIVEGDTPAEIKKLS